MENINDAISLVDASKDENQAVRHVIRSVHELRQFYINTLRYLRYRLNDEFAFEDKANEFKSAEPARKRLLASEMEQIVLQCCFSHDHDLSGKGDETSDLYWLLRDLASLKEAVARHDERMAGLYLNEIWPEKFGNSLEENYFRRALVTVSGTELQILERFEEHLLSAIRSRRYLNLLESNGPNHPGQFDEIGLDEAQHYLDTEAAYVRMPWLTDFVLVLILDALIAAARLHLQQPQYRFRFWVKKAASSWVAGLTLLRNEIALRAYDADEMIRRLRQFEDLYGLYGVPSLVFPLLKIQAGKH